MRLFTGLDRDFVHQFNRPKDFHPRTSLQQYSQETICRFSIRNLPLWLLQGPSTKRCPLWSSGEMWSWSHRLRYHLNLNRLRLFWILWHYRSRIVWQSCHCLSRHSSILNQGVLSFVCEDTAIHSLSIWCNYAPSTLQNARIQTKDWPSLTDTAPSICKRTGLIAHSRRIWQCFHDLAACIFESHSIKRKTHLIKIESIKDSKKCKLTLTILSLF